MTDKRSDVTGPSVHTRTKVLYIAGWGRSGTTILDNLLGQADGFVSTGELHSVWQRGLIEGRACGCGLAVRQCDVWRRAFEVGFGGVDEINASDAVTSQAILHTRHARRALRALRSGTALAEYPYAQYLRKMYRGVATGGSADVIVDSSKFPTDAIIAAALPEFEVYVVHMIRDPRAVAFSWGRQKPVQDKTKNGGLLRRVGIVRSTTVWLFYTAIIERYVKPAVGVDHYTILHYEDFASKPEEAIADIFEFVNEAPLRRPIFHENEVELKVTHTASGNPGRFKIGRINISLDSEWMAAMPSWQKALVSAVTWPVMSHARRTGSKRSGSLDRQVEEQLSA